MATMAFFQPQAMDPLFLVSASLPHLASLSIVHNLHSSLNCCHVALHCMHQYPAMDSFLGRGRINNNNVRSLAAGGGGDDGGTTTKNVEVDKVVRQ